MICIVLVSTNFNLPQFPCRLICQSLAPPNLALYGIKEVLMEVIQNGVIIRQMLVVSLGKPEV